MLDNYTRKGLLAVSCGTLFTYNKSTARYEFVDLTQLFKSTGNKKTGRLDPISD